MKRLGVLLTVGPESQGFSQMMKILAQSTEDKRVYFYAIDKGVSALETVMRLDKSGWHVYGCAFSARQRGITLDQEKVIFCGFSVLADILSNVDEMMVVVDRDPFVSISSKETSLNEKRRVLVEVVSDPRVSHKAAEGIRMAAGVQAWERVKIEVGFSGEGVYCLAANKESLVEGEALEKELLLFKEAVLWANLKDLKERKLLPFSKVKKLSSEEILQRREETWLKILF